MSTESKKIDSLDVTMEIVRFAIGIFLIWFFLIYLPESIEISGEKYDNVQEWCELHPELIPVVERCMDDYNISYHNYWLIIQEKNEINIPKRKESLSSFLITQGEEK